jgi:hypothetical protein
MVSYVIFLTPDMAISQLEAESALSMISTSQLAVGQSLCSVMLGSSLSKAQIDAVMSLSHMKPLER